MSLTWAELSALGAEQQCPRGLQSQCQRLIWWRKPDSSSNNELRQKAEDPLNSKAHLHRKDFSLLILEICPKLSSIIFLCFKISELEAQRLKHWGRHCGCSFLLVCVFYNFLTLLGIQKRKWSLEGIKALLFFLGLDHIFYFCDKQGLHSRLILLRRL